MGVFMNKTFLFGNITQEPKLFTGKATILKFKIATNEKYKIKDEWKEKTFYHQVSVWGERANYLSSILQVGQPVVVEGKNVSGKKTDDRTGETKYYYEVEAIKVHPINNYKANNLDDEKGDDLDV